jgi:S-adenosylmethionine/arginine decarboxylase-like enzyme
MAEVGIELLVDFYDCQSQSIQDIPFLRSTVMECIDELGVNFLEESCSKSNSHAEYLAIIAESHVGVRVSFPDRTAYVSIFTCNKEIDPRKAIPVFERSLKPKRKKIKYFGKRGENFLLRDQ